MKSIVIKTIILLTFGGLITASVLKKPETDAKNDKLNEKRREDRIKEERKEKARLILLEELEILKKEKRNPVSSSADFDIADYLLSSEYYDFEAENISGKNDDNAQGFEVSLIDSAKGIYDAADTGSFGKGETVKYCRGRNKSLQISDGIILNKPIKIGNGKPESFKVRKGRIDFNYIITPRMRIDTAFTSNLENAEFPVCLITITNSSGDTVLNSNIYVRDFYDEESFRYDGSYRTEYRNGSLMSNLIIPADKLFKEGAGENAVSEFNIEIYYYGYCDMWIDYVRVENQIANDFLTKQNASLIKSLEDYSGRNIMGKVNGKIE